MTAAWFCPSCQKYHAPHCDTCPGPGIAAGLNPYFGPGSNSHPDYDPCANCKGACGNAACPKINRAYGIGPGGMTSGLATTRQP